MDAIRIQIIQGCDESGNGGTVIDDATGVLGSLPSGTTILDALMAAMADAYGLEVPAPTQEDPDNVQQLAPARNVSYRMRMFATDIVRSYANKTAAAAAAAAAQSDIAAALASVTIVDN